MENINMFYQGIIPVVLLIIGWVLGNYMPSYFGKKGENLATKEDIAEITKRIESVKVDLNKLDRVNEKKYAIKYDACMTMLGIVDSILSHAIKVNYDGEEVNISKQPLVATSVIRQCHNELLTTIDNPKIIELFIELVISEKDTKKLIDRLNQLRPLVRKELQFGDVVYSGPWLSFTGGYLDKTS